MQRFLTHFLLFLSPVLLIGMIGTAFLFRYGELTSLDYLSAVQQEGEYLLGKRYIPFASDPKYHVYTQLGPEVTTLGNSRVLQVRQEFFNEHTMFYNHAQVASVQSLRVTLEKLLFETEPPELVIVALEQSYFAPGDKQTTNVADDGIGTTNWLLAYSSLFRDVITLKIAPSDLLSTPPIGSIGVEAGLNQAGYRADGSRKYSPFFLDHTFKDNDDYEFADSKRRIGANSGLFKQGQDFDADMLRELEQLYLLAREHNIHLVTFFPPYAPTVFEYMSEPQYDYSYHAKAANEIEKLTEQYGYQFNDYTDPGVLNLTDADFYDGFHPKENVMKAILSEMSADDDVLASYLR